MNLSHGLLNHLLRVGTLCLSLGYMLPVHAQLIISEVFYDAVGSDNGVTFIELYGDPGTSLDDYWLEGINGFNGESYRTVSLSGVVPADGLFVISDDRGDGMTDVLFADLVANVDFQNGPDSIVLMNSQGVVDALGYGNFSSAFFAGEGSAAQDVSPGSSLARLGLLLDSDDNLNDFLVLTAPTPGSMSSSTVPLPAALYLFLAGMTVLFVTGRRHAIFCPRPRSFVA